MEIDMTDYCNEYISGLREKLGEKAVVLPSMILNDGSLLSVQASQFHYSSPRVWSEKYTKVEICFDNNNVTANIFFNDYIIDDIYIAAYVPVELVNDYIQISGGIDYEKISTVAIDF
jgi:hypothetical protein